RPADVADDTAAAAEALVGVLAAVALRLPYVQAVGAAPGGQAVARQRHRLGVTVGGLGQARLDLALVGQVEQAGAAEQLLGVGRRESQAAALVLPGDVLE